MDSASGKTKQQKIYLVFILSRVQCVQSAEVLGGGDMAPVSKSDGDLGKTLVHGVATSGD